MPTFMKMTGPKIFSLVLPVLLFVFSGCFTSTPKKAITQNKSEEITALQKTILEQQELLQNLQALTADQMQRNSELELAIPPGYLL
ncbi:MAG: hypothetical protein VYD61_07340 [SAR324 cluster bacterium]|nr:hypothetical protein [SAR324 cluster bacterium]